MGIKTLARCPPRAFLLSARFHKYPPVSLVFFSFVPLALLPPPSLPVGSFTTPPGTSGPAASNRA